MTTAARDTLSLVCHPQGTIVRVFSGDVGRFIPVGSALTELLLPESWVRCQRFLHRAARRGASVGCELTVRCADGPQALRFVALRIASDALLIVAAREAEMILTLLSARFDPQRDEGTNGLATSTQQRALDELGRLNNELVNSQRELAKEQSIVKAQAAQRSNQLAVVAHELRTPMAVVLGYCELLARSVGGQSDPATGLIQHVCASVQYALSLLSQTLEYARLESEALTLRLAQTDLGELTSNVVEVHRALATAKDIRIDLLIGLDVPPVWVDRVLIQQLVGNLLTNAIKYSPPHTMIQVHVECADEHARLVVRDQGLGIDPAYLPRLFHPFQTTNTQATAGERSTGLGLAIVRKSAEAHGGAVEVQSTLQHGSTFVVTLPLKPHNRSDVMVLREREPGRRSMSPRDGS